VTEQQAFVQFLYGLSSSSLPDYSSFIHDGSEVLAVERSKPNSAEIWRRLRRY